MRNGAPRAGRLRRGLTLIELLLVMTMISIVMGVGLGLFASLNPAERAAVGMVQNAMRSAHNSAVARTAPARVRIDPATNEIVAEALRVIGTWHFESEPIEGAFELGGVLLGGGRVVSDGFHGKGLSFAGEPRGSRLEIPVQRDPAFDFSSGFAVELAIFPEELADARLLTIGRSFLMQVTRRGAVHAYFVPAMVDATGRSSPGEKAWLRTPPGSIQAGRWSRVKVRYDRSRFAIEVDGVELAQQPEEAPVWEIAEPLVIAGGAQPFPGTVDSLVVSAVATDERMVLPEGVIFPADTPTEVFFSSDGGLDPRRHRAPVEVAVEFDDGRRQIVRVNLYGTIE